MNRYLLTLVLCSIVPAAGCGMMSEDSQASTAATTKSVAAGAIDVNKLLGGITDGPSAEAAKGPLDAAIASLKGMLTTGDGTTAEASGGMKQLGTDALAKFGISGDTLGMITGLLANPAVASVIGPTLNQLKSLLPTQ
jgi:hypothetical protein